MNFKYKQETARLDMAFQKVLPALVFILLAFLMLACNDNKKENAVVAPAAPNTPPPGGPAGGPSGGPGYPGGPGYSDMWWDGNRLTALNCEGPHCGVNVGQLIVHGRRGARGCSAVLIAPQVAVTATRCFDDFDMNMHSGMNRRCAVQFANEFVTCRRIVNGQTRVDGGAGEVSLLALDRPLGRPGLFEIATELEVESVLRSGSPFNVYGVSRTATTRQLVARQCNGIPANEFRGPDRRRRFETLEFQRCSAERAFLGGAITTPSGRLVGIITSVKNVFTLDQRRAPVGMNSFQVTRLFPPRYLNQERRYSRFSLEWRDWSIDFDLDGDGRPDARLDLGK